MRGSRSGIELSGDRVYFHADDGRAYRVYDCRPLRGGALRGRRPPDTAATCRVFVAADLTRRLYVFARHDKRTLEPRLLARQLEASGYLGSEKFSPDSRGPR
jgi:hypothetical protein